MRKRATRDGLLTAAVIATRQPRRCGARRPTVQAGTERRPRMPGHRTAAAPLGGAPPFPALFHGRRTEGAPWHHHTTARPCRGRASSIEGSRQPRHRAHCWTLGEQPGCGRRSTEGAFGPHPRPSEVRRGKVAQVRRRPLPTSPESPRRDSRSCSPARGAPRRTRAHR